jgi:hypothetical protein
MVVVNMMSNCILYVPSACDIPDDIWGSYRSNWEGIVF